MDTFQQVYEENAKKVYRFLLSLTGDSRQAEELLQETFYQAFLHIRQFEGRSSLYTWLCQIGKNAWFKECNRKKRQALEFDKLEAFKEHRGNFTVEEQVIREEQCRVLREAVKKLPEPYQDVFCLHVFGEIKLKDIAVMFGKSESWARVTYYRAKERILKEVER